MEALRQATMTLTDDEIRWALAIKEATKEAAGKDGNLREISDFEYAHYAIVTKGQVEVALKKIEMIQSFRDEYHIEDNPEEGMDILQKLTIILQPWFIVALDYAPSQGHFIVVYDYAKLNPGAVDMPADWRVWLGGLYYIFQLVQCNFLACREGLVHIAECQGMWTNNFSADFMVQNWTHLMEHYPLNNKECSWLHTPLVGNLQHACYKSLMGPIADVIRVGCDFEGYDGRIDEMFKTPNAEAAKQRLLARYEAYLQVRYHHQAVFQLPTNTRTAPDPPARLPPDPPANARGEENNGDDNNGQDEDSSSEEDEDQSEYADSEEDLEESEEEIDDEDVEEGNEDVP